MNFVEAFQEYEFSFLVVQESVKQNLIDRSSYGIISEYNNNSNHIAGEKSS